MSYLISCLGNGPRNLACASYSRKGGARTVFIKQGETRSATARCPKGQYLITGGFQRTDFGADGGNYVTESRADGTRAWRVSGSAFPLGGGELTAIAYCVRHKGPILTEVSANADIPVAEETATATTLTVPVRAAADQHGLQHQRLVERLLRRQLPQWGRQLLHDGLPPLRSGRRDRLRLLSAGPRLRPRPL